MEYCDICDVDLGGTCDHCGHRACEQCIRTCAQCGDTCCSDCYDDMGDKCFTCKEEEEEEEEEVKEGAG